MGPFFIHFLNGNTKNITTFGGLKPLHPAVAACLPAHQVSELCSCNQRVTVGGKTWGSVQTVSCLRPIVAQDRWNLEKHLI